MNDKELRLSLLQAVGYDADKAKECYAFVTDEKAENHTDNMPDGIYLMYEQDAELYTGMQLTEQKQNDCTGIGIKFGGQSLVLALNDIGDKDIELTTGKGGTRFITSYHQAAEDMDGMAATNDIRGILNMDMADDGHIPSLGELYFILAHFSRINAALKAVGGEPLCDDWYWSSTQYSAATAWNLYLNDGTASNGTKAAFQYRVRPVSAFLL